MDKLSKDLSLIVALIGKYENLVDDFDVKIKQLKKLENNTEIIIVADGPEWTYSPLFQMLSFYIEEVKIIINEKETHLPAVLYNEGIKIANGKFVTFSNLLTKDTIDLVNMFYNNLSSDSKEILYIRNVNENFNGIFPSNQNRYGFLQIDDFYCHDEVFIKTNVIKALNGFNPTPILQKSFLREALLRLAQKYDFEEIGVYNRKIINFNNYPFNKVFCNKKDLINRFIIRNSRPAFDNNLSYNDINQSFINDLKVEEAEIFHNLTGLTVNQTTKYNKKYKIMVLGGYWEYHHNQICFFNYFENLVGQGFCTYNVAFEYNTLPIDLHDYDLVIFSRCRSDNVIKLIDYCNKQNIPTIYMIDDNWITIAEELPNIGSIFVKGNPNYDNFIKAVGMCKTTWLFNDNLAEDINSYARHITKFRISVESKLFQVDNKDKNDSKIKVGFSGSLRMDDTAFKALARLSKEYKNIVIVLIGIISDEQRKLFDGVEIEEIGFASYSVYSKNITKISPDLLIAPLGKTRTERSKCYNKYVESGIVRAACLFSKTEPYTYVVNDNINGFFVEDESEHAWYQRLKSIVSNKEELRKVQKNAYNDVLNNYTVEKILPSFIDCIENIIEKELK